MDRNYDYFKDMQKSDEKAFIFREMGNYEYSKENMIGALFFYNKSIATAHSKRVASLSYGNRSAVYLEIERYEECLQNIQWARENGYPLDKMTKLGMREEKCKKMMAAKREDYENPLDLFKMSYPAKEKIPWIANCVEIKTTKKYGRGIYATRDLKAGDIISMEDPVLFMLNGDAHYQYCNICFKSCMLNLIPCDKTVFMFCSNECKQLYLKVMDFNIMTLHNFKLLSLLVNDFGGRQHFNEFIRKTDLESLKTTIFDYDLSNQEDPKYKENLMICLLALSTNSNLHSYNLKINKLPFPKKIVDHINNIISTNFVLCSNDAGGYKGSHSRCIPLFASLMNHSCLNNVDFITVDNKLAGVITKPTKTGEQLFRCYFNKCNPLCELERNLMLPLFEFECDCEVCKKNIFLFEPSLPSPIFESSGTYLEIIKKCLKEGWDYISKNTGYSIETARHWKRNTFALGMVAYYSFLPRDDKLKIFNA